MHGRAGIWNCAEESLQLEGHVVKFSAWVSLGLKVSEPESEPKVKLKESPTSEHHTEVGLLLKPQSEPQSEPRVNLKVNPE